MPSVDLSVSSSEQGGVTIVHVAGEIDVYTAPLLREVLDKQIAAGRTDLVVDLEKVTFMDSTGLGVLVGRLKLVRGQNGSAAHRQRPGADPQGLQASPAWTRCSTSTRRSTRPPPPTPRLTVDSAVTILTRRHEAL